SAPRVASRRQDVGGSRVSRSASGPCSGRAVRVGLSRVFGLHEATGERIVAARAIRPFGSLADLVERVRPSLPELESLVFAGALAEGGLFPDVYRSHAGAVRGQVVRIEGRVDESLGAITLVAEQARSLAGGD